MFDLCWVLARGLQEWLLQREGVAGALQREVEDGVEAEKEGGGG